MPRSRHREAGFHGRDERAPNADAVKLLRPGGLSIGSQAAAAAEFPHRRRRSLRIRESAGETPGIRVTGMVDDIRPYLCDSDVSSFARCAMGTGVRTRGLRAGRRNPGRGDAAEPFGALRGRLPNTSSWRTRRRNCWPDRRRLPIPAVPMLSPKPPEIHRAARLVEYRRRGTGTGFAPCGGQGQPCRAFSPLSRRRAWGEGFSRASLKMADPRQPALTLTLSGSPTAQHGR